MILSTSSTPPMASEPPTPTPTVAVDKQAIHEQQRQYQHKLNQVSLRTTSGQEPEQQVLDSRLPATNSNGHSNGNDTGKRCTEKRPRPADRLSVVIPPNLNLPHHHQSAAAAASAAAAGGSLQTPITIIHDYDLQGRHGLHHHQLLQLPTPNGCSGLLQAANYSSLIGHLNGQERVGSFTGLPSCTPTSADALTASNLSAINPFFLNVSPFCSNSCTTPTTTTTTTTTSNSQSTTTSATKQQSTVAPVQYGHGIDQTGATLPIPEDLSPSAKARLSSGASLGHQCGNSPAAAALAPLDQPYNHHHHQLHVPTSSHLMLSPFFLLSPDHEAWLRLSLQSQHQHPLAGKSAPQQMPVFDETLYSASYQHQQQHYQNPSLNADTTSKQTGAGFRRQQPNGEQLSSNFAQDLTNQPVNDQLHAVATNCTVDENDSQVIPAHVDSGEMDRATCVHLQRSPSAGGHQSYATPSSRHPDQVRVEPISHANDHQSKAVRRTDSLAAQQQQHRILAPVHQQPAPVHDGVRSTAQQPSARVRTLPQESQSFYLHDPHLGRQIHPQPPPPPQQQQPTFTPLERQHDATAEQQFKGSKTKCELTPANDLHSISKINLASPEADNTTSPTSKRYKQTSARDRIAANDDDDDDDDDGGSANNANGRLNGTNSNSSSNDSGSFATNCASPITVAMSSSDSSSGRSSLSRDTSASIDVMATTTNCSSKQPHLEQPLLKAASCQPAPTLADKKRTTSGVNGAAAAAPARKGASKAGGKLEPADSGAVKKKSKGGRKKKQVTHEEMLARKNRSKERNRVAAKRCRQKRKQFIDDLCAKIDSLNDLNRKLQKENAQLRDEVHRLKKQQH